MWAILSLKNTFPTKTLSGSESCFSRFYLFRRRYLKSPPLESEKMEMKWKMCNARFDALDHLPWCVEINAEKKEKKRGVFYTQEQSVLIYFF